MENGNDGATICTS